LWKSYKSTQNIDAKPNEKENQRKKILTLYNRALALDKKNSLALHFRGMLHSESDPDLALSDFTASLEIQPCNPNPLKRRAELFEKKGRHLEAQEDMRARDLLLLVKTISEEKTATPDGVPDSAAHESKEETAVKKSEKSPISFACWCTYFLPRAPVEVDYASNSSLSSSSSSLPPPQTPPADPPAP